MSTIRYYDNNFNGRTVVFNKHTIIYHYVDGLIQYIYVDTNCTMCDIS